MYTYICKYIKEREGEKERNTPLEAATRTVPETGIRPNVVV